MCRQRASHARAAGRWAKLLEFGSAGLSLRGERLASRLPHFRDERRSARSDAAVVQRGGKIFNQAAREHIAQHLTAGGIEKMVSGLMKLVTAHRRDSAE